MRFILSLMRPMLVARCTPTDLEAGSSSTGPASNRAIRQERSAWPFVQDALAEWSQQRGAKTVDLLIAAAAESAGLVVLYYDHDFDLVAGITDQPDGMDPPAGTVS